MINIIVVEPSKTVQAVIQQTLSSLDVSIKCTGTIAHCKEIVENTYRIDFVIMGSVLEDGEADELIEHLRHADATLYSPVYLLTSSDDKGKYSRFLGKGITEIFQKNQMIAFTEFLTSAIHNETRHETLSGHILYIEDSPSQTLAIKQILEYKGLTITHFDNAEDAHESFLREPFDLVLCDLMLKGKMTGLGLLRKIRHSKGELKNTPVIILSSDQDVARKIELIRVGASDYISKPVIEEELIVRITNLLLNKQLQDQIKIQQDKLVELAMTDQLTKLYNRNFLLDYASKKISEAQRHGWDCPLILTDVDHFKSINDTHGHDVGDIVLREVGDVLTGSCRHEDIAARFGGEEFIVMLPHCSYDDALSKAEHIRQKLQSLTPHGLNITASFGVSALAKLDGSEMTFDNLFKLADFALYKAKDNGRNQVVGCCDTALSR